MKLEAPNSVERRLGVVHALVVSWVVNFVCENT